MKYRSSSSSSGYFPAVRLTTGTCAVAATLAVVVLGLLGTIGAAWAADVTLTANADRVRGGQVLDINIALRNPLGAPVDILVGAAVAEYGLVFLSGSGQLVSGLQNPADFPRRGGLGPGGQLDLRLFFRMPPTGVPISAATFFAALTPLNALKDGSIDPGDVVAFDLREIEFVPTSVEYLFDAVSPATEALVRQRIAEALETQREVFGVSVRNVLIVASNGSVFLSAHLGFWNGIPGTQYIDFFQSTSGLSSGGVLWLNTTLLGNDSNGVVYHELFHVLQSDLSNGLAGSVPDSQTPTIGPRWLIEGSAVYVQFLTTGRHGGITLEQVRSGLRAQARQTSNSLQSMESWTGMLAAAGASYGLGFSAVDYLTGVRGVPPSALATFWSQIGGGATWEEAFQSAFGLTVSDFYSAFEQWRLVNL